MGIEEMTDATADESARLFESLYGRPLRYRPLTRHEPTRPAYVLREAGQTIGFATAVEWAPDVLEIDNLLVHPDWQGRGWGSTLVRRIIDDCPGSCRAVISTNSDIHEPGRSGKRDATRFYRRLGFTVIASTPQTRVLWRDV